MVNANNIRPAITAWKEPTVNKIVDKLNNSKTVAVVDLVNLPSRQVQEIRAKIKGQIKILVTRKRLLRRALENSKVQGSKDLANELKGMSALICSDMDSFELFRVLKANMSDSAARAGQLAPFDIEVKAGPTPFSPGPILSELGEVGLQAAIEGGKVVIKEDAVVVKEGEAVSEKAASILSRLEVKPIKIGLNLISALEEGKLMSRKVLDIDISEYIKNIERAHSDAFKLAIAQAIPTKDTIEALVQKAASEALALAREGDILTSETAGEVISKAERAATALKADVDAHKPAEQPAKEEESKPEEKTKGTSDSSENSPEQSDQQTQEEKEE